MGGRGMPREWGGIARGATPSRGLKNAASCHSERSEESAFRQNPRKKQIPRANTALGMTALGVFQQPARREARRVWRLFRELQIEGYADAVYEDLPFIQQLLICDFRIGKFLREVFGEEKLDRLGAFLAAGAWRQQIHNGEIVIVHQPAGGNPVQQILHFGSDKQVEGLRGALIDVGFFGIKTRGVLHGHLQDHLLADNNESRRIIVHERKFSLLSASRWSCR